MPPAAPGRAHYLLLTTHLPLTTYYSLTTHVPALLGSLLHGRTWSCLLTYERNVLHRPHLVVAAGDPRLRALDSGWARGLIGLNKAVGALAYTRACDMCMCMCMCMCMHNMHMHMHMHMHIVHMHMHMHMARYRWA